MPDFHDECPFAPGAIPFYEMRGFGYYESGLETGKWTYWYGNGKKAKQGEYLGGKKTGYWTTWYGTGEKSGEGWYEDGKQNGWQTVWLRNGQKGGEGEMVDGKPHGIWVTWGEDGTLGVVTNHSHGQAHGRWMYWGEAEEKGRQGPVVRIIDWENDKPVKTFIFENGRMVETEYVEEWWLDSEEASGGRSKE